MERIVNKSRLIISLILVFSMSFVFSPAGPYPALAETTKTIAVIPFEINSGNDITYIRSGVFSMFYSRLAWKDRVKVVGKSKIRSIVQDLSGLGETEFVTKAGELSQADYVLIGSITEFAGAYSFDTKVFDLKEMTYLTFYEQAGEAGEIIKKFDIIAAKINKKVFDRTTLAYEKFEKDKTINAQDLQRMNPERMMPGIKGEKAAKPWWKFW
jgi:TolB-like protein